MMPSVLTAGAFVMPILATPGPALTLLAADALAQLPAGAVYVQPLKLLVVALLIGLWALYAQWVDKDAVAVNTYRVAWNLATLGCGVAAIALLLFLPQFWAGFAAFAVIQIALGVLYVVHRNGLVEQADKVLTAQHIERLMQQGLRGKGKAKEKKPIQERVRLTAADRKVVRLPEDEIEREQFRLTQELLFDALWRRAGVLEINPAGQASKISYLVDGMPGEREPLPRPEGDAIILYLKKLAGLNLEERRKPQGGKLWATLGDHAFEMALRTQGSTAGEKLTVRVVGAEKSFKVADLGLTEKQLDVVREIMGADRGLVLLSAPQGGGRTTTVYSLARSHDAFLLNIQTLEYAREMDVDNITQRVHEPADDRTFANDLQKLVRTDPNVIIIPELRDRQAAAIAAQAAAEKQKVYVGLQATDLWDAIRKWQALVGDAKLVSRSLLAVLHQRLVRTLCIACKAPYKPDAATLRKLNLPADKVLFRPPEPQYDKQGNPVLCQACQGTGYVGRSAVFHILVVDEGLTRLLREGGSASDVQAYAVKQGVPGLQQQALQKVFDGATSIEEVVRVTRLPGPAAVPRPAAPARSQSGSSG
jgi:type II secretory ATPase GspE/PulE/Tfp pilus assembly ATPase PilB-like protein